MSKEYEQLAALLSTPPAFDYKTLKVLLMSPPKHGKTFMAATMSDYFPDPLPSGPNMEPIVLEDMLWLPFDVEALSGLSVDYGIVPRLLKSHDLEHMTGKALILFMEKEFAQIVRPMVKAGLISKICCDTFSSAMKRIVNYYMEKSKDGRDAWGKVAQTGIRFFESLVSMPCDVITLCHTKEFKEQDAAAKKMKQMKQKAAGVPGDFSIFLDIPGSTADYLRANSSMILPLLMKKEKGRAATRHVYPYGNELFGIEGATRFQVNLSDEEPADFRVLKAKIRANVKG